ncbi:hypothetical protein [Embleya sp. NPDC020630]|uniref:hypothetical protein n=1 Tax=Embleya sp. NPDC020630 TaxID=3363979 RepID=UPI00379935F6
MRFAKAVARAVASGPVGDRSEWVTVSAVNGDGTVDVTAPGGTIPSVTCLYASPAIGHMVVMVRMAGGDRYIPGKRP